MSFRRILQWYPWLLFLIVVFLSAPAQNVACFLLVPPLPSPPPPPPPPIQTTSGNNGPKKKFLHTTIITRLAAHQQQPSQYRSSKNNDLRPAQYPNDNNIITPRHRDFRKKNDPLVRVIDSIVYYGQDNNNNNINININNSNDQEGLTVPSRELIQALTKLRSARTPAQIRQVGERFLTQDLLQQQPWPIQERLLKAMALAGLTEHATTLLRYLLLLPMSEKNNDEQGYYNYYNYHNTTTGGSSSGFYHHLLPSYISYTAVLSALRKAGQVDTLRDVLQELVQASKRRRLPRRGNGKDGNQQQQQQQHSIHIMAINIYLAALCDNHHHHHHRDHHHRDHLLNEAAEWVLLRPEAAREEFGISFDLTSYNTVLNGAAKAGNQTLVDAVWKKLTSISSSSSSSSSLQPDIRSYNARMLATVSYERRLEIWEELRKAAKKRPGSLAPDRFTIDLILLPLIQRTEEKEKKDNSGKQQWQQTELESVLDTFVAHHSAAIVRDAFSAFMNTLVQNGKLTYARRLFDLYIVPCLRGGGSGDDEEEDELLDRLLESRQRPDTRHFNILIDGYRRDAMNAAIAAASSAVAITNNVDEDTQQSTTPINKSSPSSSSSSSLAAADQRDNTSNTKTNLILQAKDFTRQEQAARAEGQKLFRRMNRAGISPDPYTLTSMMGLCDSTEEVVQLLVNPLYERWISAAVVRSAMTASGQLGNPGLACVLFDSFYSQPRINQPNSPRLWNVLLNAFSDSAEQDNPLIQFDTPAAKMFLEGSDSRNKNNEIKNTVEADSISELLQGKTCTDAVREVLHLMNDPDLRPWGPPPDAQTYCVAAAALQYAPETGPDLAMELFRNATSKGVSADGRFVNAIFRCFGDDINQALIAWKSDIRRACIMHETSSPSSSNRSMNKNLIAAYNGLLHVCGRAQRPDVGVRLVYAMNREGIEPNEVSLNNYRAGKRLGTRLMGIKAGTLSSSQQQQQQQQPQRTFGGGQFPKLTLPKLNMVQQYENILYVECTKYNQYNKRMSKDQRVRIIV